MEWAFRFVVVFAVEIVGGILPPTMDSLRVGWQSMPIRVMPVAQNFIGAATLRQDEVYSFDNTTKGVGLIGLGPISLTPYRGNFFNSTFTCNGHVLPLQNVEWSGCEGTRQSDSGRVSVLNRVRLPFERHAILQHWDIKTKDDVTIRMLLDGPFFRRCDSSDFGATPCGWPTTQPVDRQNFTHSIFYQAGGVTIAVTADSLTRAVAASAWWCNTTETATCSATLQLAQTQEDSGGFLGTVIFNASRSGAFHIRHAVAVAETVTQALESLQNYTGDKRFEAAFRDACGMWEDRWASAFGHAESHFSGSLPVMKSDSPALDRLYNWAAMALVSLERTNMPSFPRQFVISEGPSNSLRGDADMGGTGQFLWDLSFAATSYSLLDPMFTKNVLRYIITNADFNQVPLGIPQAWDPYPTDSTAGAGSYCFDYVSAFLFVQQYVVTTNDTSLLTEKYRNSHNHSMKISGLDFLRKVAWHWTAYNRSRVSQFLVDYGSDKRSFLEAVPTYTDVIPALQVSNAGMLLSLARLLETGAFPLKHEVEIDELRGNGSAIIRDALQYQYVPGKGFWQCLHANGSLPVQVRAISDLIYVGLGVGLLGREEAALPKEVRKEMVSYFEAELLGNGWTRALSLSDPVMAEVQSHNPSLLAKLAMRADWTGTGAYGGLPGLAADALASLEGGMDSILFLLRNISLAAESSMPSQGIAVTTPPFMVDFLNKNNGIAIPTGPYAAGFPEFFDEKAFGIGSWWPHSLRCIQNAVAAIVDSFVRSVFGWRPDWSTWSNQSIAALNSALYLPKVPRSDFRGTLHGLITPYGKIDLTAGPTGLSWAFSDTANEDLWI